MSLKKSSGNMYPWVSHTKSFLGGECPHGCRYCYVQAMARRFPSMRARYGGALSFDARELAEPLGQGWTIFIEHMNDLWAHGVPDEWIRKVLARCRAFPGNTYVYQSKNPRRYFGFLDVLPRLCLLGTTIESTAWFDLMGNAPAPVERMEAMAALPARARTFVTIEPILDFDPPELAHWLMRIRPEFVNIGADSKGCGLPEPPRWKILRLIRALKDLGIEIRQKNNLQRLVSEQKTTK